MGGVAIDADPTEPPHQHTEDAPEEALLPQVRQTQSQVEHGGHAQHEVGGPLVRRRDDDGLGDVR